MEKNNFKLGDRVKVTVSQLGAEEHGTVVASFSTWLEVEYDVDKSRERFFASSIGSSFSRLKKVEEDGEEIQSAEARGFLAALRFMADRELSLALREAFKDQGEHFGLHLSQKLEKDSWGDRKEFYLHRIDPECQRKILEHYMKYSAPWRY